MKIRTISIASLALLGSLVAHAETTTTPQAKKKPVQPRAATPAPRPPVQPAAPVISDQTWFGFGLGAYRGERTSGGAARINVTHTTGSLLLRAQFSGYVDDSYDHCFLFCGSINETALMAGLGLSPDIWIATGINRTATHGFGDPVPGFVTAGVPVELIWAPRWPHPVGLEVAIHGDLNHKTSLAALTVGIRFGEIR